MGEVGRTDMGSDSTHLVARGNLAKEVGTDSDRPAGVDKGLHKAATSWDWIEQRSMNLVGGAGSQMKERENCVENMPATLG